MVPAKAHFYSSKAALAQQPEMFLLTGTPEPTQPLLNALLFTSVDGVPATAKARSCEITFLEQTRERSLQWSPKKA